MQKVVKYIFYIFRVRIEHMYSAPNAGHDIFTSISI